MAKTPRAPRQPVPSATPEFTPPPAAPVAAPARRRRAPQVPAAEPAPAEVPARPPAARRKASATTRTAVKKAAESATSRSTPSRRKARPRALRILMVASEAVPYAKTGGLGDVVGALPRALARLGHDVTVVMPRYRGVDVGETPAVPITVALSGAPRTASAYVMQEAAHLRTVFVDRPEYFDREGIYGIGADDYDDNPARFAWLTVAAFEFARVEGVPVDIVHTHDWPGGLAPVYLRMRYRDDPVLGRAAAVFTIHNVAFKGLCAADWLPRLGLDWSLFHVDALEYWLHASFLKGGVVFADAITAVSRRYAEELQRPETAFGFDGLVRARRDVLTGIANGIDVDTWDPAQDPHLPAPYDAANLEGKAVAKRRLLDTLGLPVEREALERPIVAMISRMVDQKGLDLIAAVADQLRGLDATFVIMGAGEARYQEMWRTLARQSPDRVAVRIGFDEGLSHLIEAGADLFMMPSHYEPCGLNQMYSLRYGTVPVVRATGGLADTVADDLAEADVANGFTFEEPSGAALLAALRRALGVYRDAPARWRALQQAGMTRDFSWDVSARAYLDVYDQALQRRAH